MAGVPTLIGNQNNSLLNAAVRAEQEKARQFGVLGQATGMKAGEDKAAFQQNEMYPFESRYNLMSMNAAGNRESQRNSTQNAYSNLSTATSIFQNNVDNGNNMFGGKKTGGGGGNGSNSFRRWNNGGQNWWQN